MHKRMFLTASLSSLIRDTASCAAGTQLANARSSPVSPGRAALLGFCNGFAEEVVQTERLNPGASEDLAAHSCAQMRKDLKEFADPRR